MLSYHLTMSDPATPPRILFVCLGNICRSPAAEGVVRRLAEGRPLVLDSAGTGNWHVGEPPYGHMQRAAKRRGYDLSALRARQVKVQDFKDFDLILAMDPGTGATLKLFMDYAPQTSVTAVPDPYYTRDFDGVLELIEAAAQGLLTSL